MYTSLRYYHSLHSFVPLVSIENFHFIKRAMNIKTMNVFIRAMVRIISSEQRWHVPFNEAIETFHLLLNEHVFTVTRIKHYLLYIILK